MGSAIVKVDQETDRYLVFSSITDNFTHFGTRKQIRKGLRKKWGTDSTEQIDRMLERSDQYGSSSFMGRFRWNDGPEMLMNVEHGKDLPEAHVYAIPRENLGALYDRFMTWHKEKTKPKHQSYLDLLVVLDEYGKVVAP